KQRSGHPVSGKGRHGVRWDVRSTSVGRYGGRVREIGQEAVLRFGIWNGGGADWLFASARRLESLSGDGRRADDPGGVKWHTDYAGGREQGHAGYVHGQSSAPRQGQPERTFW